MKGNVGGGGGDVGKCHLVGPCGPLQGLDCTSKMGNLNFERMMPSLLLGQEDHKGRSSETREENTVIRVRNDGEWGQSVNKKDGRKQSACG